MDVGEMDFNGWKIHRRDRVSKGDARMGESGSIDDYGVTGAARVLDPTDQLALVVGLPKLNLRTESFSSIASQGLNVRQSRSTIAPAGADS